LLELEEEVGLLLMVQMVQEDQVVVEQELRLVAQEVQEQLTLEEEVALVDHQEMLLVELEVQE
jgi:hypothetical protein